MVDGDIQDNLTKMIVNILKPDLEEMRRYGYKAAEDEEESKIEERITQIKAEEYLEVWKRLCIKEERSTKGQSERNAPLLSDNKVKD